MHNYSAKRFGGSIVTFVALKLNLFARQCVADHPRSIVWILFHFEIFVRDCQFSAGECSEAHFATHFQTLLKARFLWAGNKNLAIKTTCYLFQKTISATPCYSTLKLTAIFP